MPAVSVVLNSYNQSQYLTEAVESVLGQTFQDFELIVLDNGSTDSSGQVLERYASHPKVRLCLHTKNEPITRRFNQGVALAQGEYISFLYSDDFYMPAKLERQIECFSRLSSDYGVVYGPAYLLNDLDRTRSLKTKIGRSGYILKNMFEEYLKGPIDMITPLTRKACLQRYPFNERIFAEGEAIFFRIAMSYQFDYLDLPLAVNRDHARNAGKDIKANTQIAVASLETLGSHNDFPPHLLPTLKKYQANVLREHGWQMVRLGKDMSWARQCFRRAARLHWHNTFHPKAALGYALSVLPAGVRNIVNGIAHNVRGVPQPSRCTAQFGGSYSQSQEALLAGNSSGDQG